MFSGCKNWWKGPTRIDEHAVLSKLTFANLSFDFMKISKPCSELKFDVRNILEKHPKGPAIITEYEKNGYLCPATRMSLVTVVTAELVKICG